MPLCLYEFRPPQTAACSSARKMALRYMASRRKPAACIVSSYRKKSNGKAFVWMDHYFDNIRTGPRYLIHPEIGTLVASSIKRVPHSATINCAPGSLWRITFCQPTSTVAKRVHWPASHLLLGRTGQKFWQAESYDHWVRDEKEMERISAYIENIPVKAGLVDSPPKYRWSSANKSVETILDAADTSVRATQAQTSTSLFRRLCPRPTMGHKQVTNSEPRLRRAVTGGTSQQSQF